MSNFLVLNLQDFGLNQDITETIRTYTPFCLCCLDRNASLVSLQRCEHARFLQQFGKPEVEYQNQLVCIQCHAMLKKIEVFRKQVAESFQLLSDQAQDLNAIYNFRTTSFIQSPVEITDYTEVDIEIKKEPNVSEPIVTIHEGTFNVKTRKKTKVKVKKEIKEKKIKEKKTKESKLKQPLHKRFEGKIQMVTLSNEEMEAERRRDATKQSYLKFPFRCESCIVGFDHEQNYDGHVQRRHSSSNGPAECPICKSVLISEKSLKKHLRNHYTRYDCVCCGKRYLNLYSIMQHCSTEHGGLGVTYKCKKCDYETTTISAFAYHRNKHKNLQCSECGKVCTSTANLKTHLFAVHKQSNRTYDCPTCGKTYNTKSGFEHHMATAHKPQPVAEAYCVDCNTQFNSVRCYKAHLRLNSRHLTKDSKKFNCPDCSAKFMTAGAMKRHHQWVHLKLLQHACPAPACHEGFRTRSLMNKHHQLVHEKVPPLRNKICQYCGKGFKTTQVLRSHIRTHTGERPLACPLCPATFAHNAALYTHKKLIHKTLPSKPHNVTLQERR